MLRLAGHVLERSSGRDVTDAKRSTAIEEGRAALVERLGRDLGYDLGAWHEQLLAAPDLRAEYRHPYAWSTVSAAIRKAISDPDRDRLVASLLARRSSKP
jgi:hypothetical protein